MVDLVFYNREDHSSRQGAERALTAAVPPRYAQIISLFGESSPSVRAENLST